jgi:hypothetical protein
MQDSELELWLGKRCVLLDNRALRSVITWIMFWELYAANTTQRQTADRALIENMWLICNIASIWSILILVG